ncbi:MAG: cytochrome c [Acidobacteriaceae bacterium]|nr:cytochrome c [Acidobacteriaceae bacterium]
MWKTAGVWASLLAASVALAQTGAPDKRPLTFSHDVAPILYKHCVACHHPGDIAPMSLMTYQDARPWAAAIRQAVVSRKMPPWLADPAVGQWSNDPRLSDAEIQTIRSWVEGPKLEGDPKDMPPAPAFPDGWKIGKPDLVLSIPVHTLEGKGPDEYTYVDVPTNFAEDRWIVAAELRPGNRKIVHHAHVFIKGGNAERKSDPTPVTQYAKWIRIRQGSLEWVRPEAPVIDNGCSVDDNGLFPGSTSSDLNSLISSYLPGREPDVYPAGTARKIPAGAVLSFQIHYSRTTGKTETDDTGVGLIFAKEPPSRVSRRIDLSNQMFMIPAGDSDHAVSECHTFDKDVLVTSLTPHMHLRGKSMQIVADLPDGRKQTLVSVPDYQFNWQFTYREKDPVFLPKGTRIEVLARFDNSVNKAGNPNPGINVRWGSASENEMMDGWIEYLDVAPTEPIKVAAANLR